MLNDGRLVLIMILALIAFGIGAVAGITIGMNGIDDGCDDVNNTHIENVTLEMTTNLDEADPNAYDPETDDVDYNENNTFEEPTF